MDTLIFAALIVTNSAAVLPTVVVEASRLEAAKTEIPAHVEVFDRESIAASCAANTVDLLEKRANLFVRKVNANPARADISMRGYGENGFGRVKILVDGEELNNADMLPQELMRVPLASVGKIEVLHGPQTVLHGGDASAGVINITSDGETGERKSELEVRGGSWGTFGAHAGTRGGDAVSYYANLDYERSDGWRNNSWYELWSAKAGLKQRFDNGAWWTLRTFYANTQYGLPGGIYLEGTSEKKEGRSAGWKPRAREASDNASHARNDTYGVSAAGKFVFTDEQYLTADFSFRSRRTESYDYLEYDAYTYGGKLQYTWDTDVNRLDVGTDLKLDLLDVNGYNAKTASGGNNDYARFGGAIFARDEVKLGEQWSAFGGVRGAWWWTRDKYMDPSARGGTSSTEGSGKSGEVAGGAGVVWHPVEEAKVFAKWSRFYHAPLADEMFSSYGVPNLALKPESGHDFELGLDWSFLKEFNFNLTGFHTEIDDEIMYMKYMNCNAGGHTARTGFETSLTWSRERVGSAGIMYSYTYARFTDGEYDGNDVPRVPRQLCRAFGECYLLDWLSVNGGMRFVGEQRYGGDFIAEGGWVPAYVIFDVGLRIRPNSGIFEGFTLALTVDNLFDKRYFDYGEYFGSHYIYPAAGRSFLVSVRYEF